MNLRLLWIAFIVFSFTGMPCGMAQGWLWAKSVGGTFNESSAAIATDTSGNVYTTGSFSSPNVTFGSFVLNNNSATGNTDIYIAKYDPNGNVMWAKSAGGSDEDYATSIALDTWGNIYVAGFFYSTSITFGTTTLTNDSTTATSDMYVVKYNPAGNVVWARKAGGTMSDRINAVKTDAAGNVIVTGSFESKYLIFGTDTVKNPLATTDDVFVIKYDSSGNFVWAKCSGQPGDNYGYAVTTDAANNIYVAGSFNSGSISFGGSVLSNSGTGTDDMFLVKYNSSGTVVWATRATGKNNDMATALGTDATGNIYVSGKFASDTMFFNSTALINSGAYDAFVAKYNATGHVIWAKSISTGTTINYAYSLSVDDTANVIIAGNFGNSTITFGTSTITNSNAGAYDLFIAKYDSLGNAQWANTTGGAGSVANGVAKDATGNIYLAGNYSDSSFYFGTNLLLNAGISTGTTDIFLAKYSQAATIVMNVASPAFSIALYPNPADGIINVALNGGGYNTIAVYDCLGRTVYHSQLAGNEKSVKINTTDFKDGIYILRTTHNGNTESATFVIRR